MCSCWSVVAAGNVQEYPSITRSDWLWNEPTLKDQTLARHSPTWKIGTVAGAGVGGGSLHFANVVIDALEDFFAAGWPPEINYSVLVPYYKKVSDILQPTKIPANQFSNRTKLLKEAAQLAGFSAQYDEVELGIKFNPAYAYDASQEPRAEDSVMTPNADGFTQGFCVHLGQCELGCPVEARNTLALNYIPRAEKKERRCGPLHVVRNLNHQRRLSRALRSDSARNTYARLRHGKTGNCLGWLDRFNRIAAAMSKAAPVVTQPGQDDGGEVVH